ncbi:MAG: chromosomal replication initiator protein DnaA [Treponema sp.]|nr:chromosomal replication initiator protein DnaA [Treponema sp.]
MSNQNYKEIWQHAMNLLKEEYISKKNENEFQIWFNMKYVEDTINTITVSVASSFMQQMITKKGYFEIVENKIKEITGQSIKIKSIVVNEEISETKESAQKEVKQVSEEKKESKPKKKTLLQEKFTFETFVPGDNSNYAYNAALAVSRNPGSKYNPILFYGGSGLGKTHLMQAIGNYIYQNSSEKLKICYISAEDFANEFTTSLSNKNPNSFKNKYRNLDVLLLDDIHFFQNKTGIQEELFYTFNALHDKGAQMVFTCDRPIREIKNMTERLVSRLSNGLCIDLTPPNYETRIAIIKKKIELEGKNLDTEIIDYIAKNVETNVRDLESAIQRVFGYAELVNKNPTIEVVKDQLKDLFTSNVSENISLDIIQKVIAENYNISVSDLKGKKRDRKYAFPRQIAIYISRELTEISYTELGIEIGGKDHSTVMHAYNKIAEEIKTDSSLQAKIQLFIKEIKEYKK